MTDAPATPDSNAGPNAATEGPALRVLGQYIKDLSFENPNAPASLRGSASQPKIDLSIDVQARGAGEDAYEVVINLSAKAERDEQALFVAELSYAGLFQVRNIDADARDAFLLIECPRLIFPFARRVLADATRDGGFPPLMLEPVDFAALYRQQASRSQGGVPGAGETPAGNA